MLLIFYFIRSPVEKFWILKKAFQAQLSLSTVELSTFQCVLYYNINMISWGQDDLKYCNHVSRWQRVGCHGYLQLSTWRNLESFEEVSIEGFPWSYWLWSCLLGIVLIDDWCRRDNPSVSITTPTWVLLGCIKIYMNKNQRKRPRFYMVLLEFLPWLPSM